MATVIKSILLIGIMVILGIFFYYYELSYIQQYYVVIFDAVVKLFPLINSYKWDTGIQSMYILGIDTYKTVLPLNAFFMFTHQQVVVCKRVSWAYMQTTPACLPEYVHSFHLC